MIKRLVFGLCLMFSSVIANDDVSIMDLKELTYNLMEDTEELSLSLDKNITKINKSIISMESKNIIVNIKLNKLNFLENYTISKKMLDYYNEKMIMKNNTLVSDEE